MTDVEAPPLTFDDFFHEHRTRLTGAVWLLIHDANEAEEIAQEALARMWERWDRVRGLADAEGYLYRTALNLVRNQRRRAVIIARRSPDAPLPSDAIGAIEERDAVARALARITRSQRAAIVLTVVLGFTSEEAGRILGTRPSTVRVLASRARTALKETIGDS